MKDLEEKNQENQTGLFAALLIILVRGYRLFLSPLLPNTCRYEPSCSYYAIEALRTHGALRGIGISLFRILRCQPFGDSGYDPVPEVLKERME